jgi:hypothetical protein
LKTYKEERHHHNLGEHEGVQRPSHEAYVEAAVVLPVPTIVDVGELVLEAV